MCAKHADGQNVTCEVEMEENRCLNCEKWQEKQSEALRCCENIFDADLDMRMFEEKCKSTCPFLNNS